MTQHFSRTCQRQWNKILRVSKAVLSAVLRISQLSENLCIWQHGTYSYISILRVWAGFVDMRIVQSYVRNWDCSLRIVLCQSNTGQNMAKKCWLDLETWPIYIKVNTPRKKQTKEGQKKNRKNDADIHLYSVFLQYKGR